MSPIVECSVTSAWWIFFCVHKIQHQNKTSVLIWIQSKRLMWNDGLNHLLWSLNPLNNRIPGQLPQQDHLSVCYGSGNNMSNNLFKKNHYLYSPKTQLLNQTSWCHSLWTSWLLVLLCLVNLLLMQMQVRPMMTCQMKPSVFTYSMRGTCWRKMA